MELSLGELLELDVIRRAQPEIVHGDRLLHRRIRWVHTSELAEAATLLKGGELLLTTGLGLAGRGPVAQERYVKELADRNVAALALELGWTFPSVPEPIAEAARASDFPVIALHCIVPFVEITEAVQSRLLDARYAELELDRRVDQLLQDELLEGHGVQSLIGAVSDLLECTVVVENVSRQVVACAGPVQRLTPRLALAHDAGEGIEVMVMGQLWGWLHLLGAPERHVGLLRAAQSRTPRAIALALLRDRESLALSTRLRQAFLRGLMSDRGLSYGELVVQATTVDFQAFIDGPLVAVAIGGFPLEEMAAVAGATESAVSEHAGLVAEVDAAVLALLPARRIGDPQVAADTLFQAVVTSMARRGARSQPWLAIGPVVTGIEAAGASLRDATATMLVAQELGMGVRAVTARGLAADRILSKVIDDPVLGSVIEEQIGPVTRHDQEHSGDLAATLWAYLTSPSATEAAHVLNVRRQSLYRRLSRIETLLGDIDSPQRRLSLLIALRGSQLLARRRGVGREVPTAGGAATKSLPDPSGSRPPVWTKP